MFKEVCSYMCSVDRCSGRGHSGGDRVHGHMCTVHDCMSRLRCRGLVHSCSGGPGRSPGDPNGVRSWLQLVGRHML